MDVVPIPSEAEITSLTQTAGRSVGGGAYAAGCGGPWESRRLWSLWDMLEFNARDFYAATTHLTEMAAWLSAKRSDTDSDFHADAPLDDEDRRFAMRALIGLSHHLAVLGARVTSMAVVEASGTIGDGSATWGSVQTSIKDINRTLSRELSLVMLLSLRPKEQEYFSPKEPLFGTDVAGKFPSLSYEIEEAGKCLALGRSTAAAFHTIRCLEAAILATSRCLGIPDPIKAADRNWGAMLRLIKTDIDRRWPTNTNRLSGDGQTFDELYGSIAGMQNPYRNATMHLEKTYTEEDAEHLFAVVRGLTKHVASRCDEDGEPKLP